MRLSAACFVFLVACGARSSLDTPDPGDASSRVDAPPDGVCPFRTPTTLVHEVSGGAYFPDDTFLYFLAATPNNVHLDCALWRVDKRTAAVTMLSLTNDYCGSIALDDQSVFFTTVAVADGAVTVTRAPKDGSTPTTLFDVPGQASSWGGVAVDDANVFVVGAGGIWAAPKSAPSQPVLRTAEPSATLLLVDASALYARIHPSTSEQIASFSKVSGALLTVLNGDVGLLRGMTQDDQFIYWNTTSDFLTGRIMRVPKVGGASEMMAEGQFRQSQLAVDSRYVYCQGPDGNLESISKSDHSQIHYPSGYHMLNDGSPLAVDDACAYWSELDQPIRVGPK